MSIGYDEAEFFKLARDLAEPVEYASFTRLYKAAVLLFDIAMVPMYDFEGMGVTFEPNKGSGKVEELRGPTHTTDGRQLDIAVYTMGSRIFDKGILASIGVAPEPAMNIQDQFILSRRDSNYWITEGATFRSIGPEELELLTLNIERA